MSFLPSLRAVFCLLAAVMLLGACTRADPQMFTIRELRAANPAKPITLLHRVSLEPRAGYEAQAPKLAPGQSELAFAAQPVQLVGRISASLAAGAAGPPQLVVQARGGAATPEGKFSPPVLVPVGYYLFCRAAREGCKLENNLVQGELELIVKPQPKLGNAPWEGDFAFRRFQHNGMSQVHLSGWQSTAVPLPTGWWEADVYLAYPAKLKTDRLTELVDLRASLLHGEFSAEAPDVKPAKRKAGGLGPLESGPLNVVLVLVALMLMVFLLARFRRDELDFDDHIKPPRTTGALIFMLGLALSFAPIAMMVLRGASGAAGAWHFQITGLAYAFAGLFLFFGRSFGVLIFFVGLAINIISSSLEYGYADKQFVSQVALPTLIGLYLLTQKVSGRLMR